MTENHTENGIQEELQHSPEFKSDVNPGIKMGVNMSLWTDREHVLYILFLERNKDKAKSKLIRRSNSFFEEMSNFIGSKTGTQCRGHHKKYEARHRFPHRIVKEEKKRLNMLLYQKLSEGSLSITQEDRKVEDVKLEETEKESKVESSSIACQTDLEGVHNPLTMHQQPDYHFNPMYMPYPQHYNFPFYNHCDLQRNPHFPTHF